MRISDWSSDVCSSDLQDRIGAAVELDHRLVHAHAVVGDQLAHQLELGRDALPLGHLRRRHRAFELVAERTRVRIVRSEEHTSELQSLMRISYAVFCLKKKKNKYTQKSNTHKEHTGTHTPKTPNNIR